MQRSARWPDTWLLVLGSISLIAWFLLLWPGDSLVVPALCSASSLQALPSLISFDAISLGTSAQLASDWALMLAAMMPPLVITSLRYVRDRSFARRRARATLLFLLGYVLVWMTAGFVLQVMAFTAARWAVPGPLLCFVVVVAIAILWQVSPAKQLCLNRCHRRPHLAAFDLKADRDAFAFGLTNGASCVGSCWALMLTLVASQGHALGMVAVTLFAFGERLEGPAPLAWRWRGPFKALRIAAAQVDLWLTMQARRKQIDGL